MAYLACMVLGSGKEMCMDEGKRRALSRTVAYKALHILLVDGIAFDICVRHIAASYHKCRRTVHRPTSMADSLVRSCRRDKSLWSGKDILDSFRRHHGSYEASADDRSSSIVRTGIDMEEVLYRMAVVAVGLFVHSCSSARRR